MMVRRLALVLIGLATLATTCHALEPAPVEPADPQPEQSTPVAAPAPQAEAQRERLAAFERGPITFTSKGRVKALMMKFDRNLHYTFKPIKKDGVTEAVEVTMIDRVDGNKVTCGRLDVTRNGTFRTHTMPLTNACNIGSIDPMTRRKLIKTDEPVVTRSQMEIQGAVHAIEATHTREGDVADDGSMRVKSVTESADGKVHLTTITTLAPDGLPWMAETTGTIAKGPINMDVNLKLTREGIEDGPSATGE